MIGLVIARKLRVRWWPVACGVWRTTEDEYLTLIAAGVAFYGLLAVVPFLAALVSCYAQLADPEQLARQMEQLTSLPLEVREFLLEQLTTLANSDAQTGTASVLSTAFALWSASKAAGALIGAMNIAYGCSERRGTVRLYATAFSLTVLFLVVTVGATLVTAGLPAVLQLLGLHAAFSALLSALPLALLDVGFLGFLAFVYRFGPAHRDPSATRVAPGACVAGIVWLLASFGLSLYLAYFANFNRVYGSLGAVVALLLWFWVSAFVVLLGAAVNASWHPAGGERAQRSPPPSRRPRPGSAPWQGASP